MTISRRSFLRGAVGATALAALPRALDAAEPAPHYLINIVRKGGWDSLWFHNAVPQAEYQALIETARPIVNGQSFINGSGNILAPYASGSGAQSRDAWSVRFPDAHVRLHPDGRTTLGPGLDFVQPADFAEICIWRGLATDGGHNLGNHILQRGGLSNNLPSFSASICAQAIAKGVARKLNYVQLASSSIELSTLAGVYAQQVQAINIPDAAAWASLTSPPTQQLGTASRRAALADTVKNLSELGVHDPTSLPATQDVLRGFVGALDGYKTVLGSNYATSADFLATVAFYADGIGAIHDNHVFKTTWFSATGVDLRANRYIATLAFRFAMAEFLVRNDLSTAIDLMVPGEGDFHNEANKECLYHLCLYAAFVLLVRRLKAAETAPGSGTSLLSRTTVVMHTEFERHPVISNLDSAMITVPGADHGDMAASIWLAGKGIKRGTVIGDFKRGPSGARYGTADYAMFRPYHPVPVDPVTGVASPGGVIPRIASLCPTMLSVFDALSYSRLNDVPVFAPVTSG
jgi:hypothetical protein